jgi:HK97 family phage major capsid protein
MPGSMGVIRKLHNERRRLVEQSRALVERMEEDPNEYNAANKAQWERMNDEITSLGVRVDELLTADEDSREADSQRERFAPAIYGSDSAPGDDPNRWMREWFMGEGPRHILADLRSVKMTRDEFGRTIIEQHDLTKGTDTAGGFTVPGGFVAKLFEHMVASSGVRSAGATVVTAEDGRTSLVPKTSTYSTAGIIAEGVTITESDPVFAQASLTTYKYAFMTQVSRELIEDTAVDLIGFLARDAGTAIGLGSGAHFATGSGTGQPLGVGGTGVAPAVGKTGATGQTTTVLGEDLMDVYHSVVGRYRRNGSWICLDATLAQIRKIREGSGATAGNFLWQPGLQAGTPDTLLGRPVFTDQAFPAMAANAYSVAFGDFASYYIIRDVRGIQFDRSDDYAFDRDTTTFRGLLRTAGTRVLDGSAGAVKFYRNSAT